MIIVYIYIMQTNILERRGRPGRAHERMRGRGADPAGSPDALAMYTIVSYCNHVILYCNHMILYTTIL